MIRQKNALIRFYYHINPDELSDEEWAVMAKDLEWILKKVHPEKKL